MLGREGRIYSLVGCVVFAGWISAEYAAFRSLNSPASWLLLTALGGFGLVAFILYLGVAREEYSRLKREQLTDGLVLLAIGFLIITADLSTIDYFSQFGPAESWLKKIVEAIVVWGVSVMITGFWLLLAPPKRVLSTQ